MAQETRSSVGLFLIALSKLAEAALLLGAALGVDRLMRGTSAPAVMTRWMQAVRIDPDAGYARSLLAHVTTISPKKLNELRIATMLYGLLFAVEGTGLLLKKRWAEYVTIVSTAGFLPLEAMELVHRFSGVKVVVTVLNVAVVVYLIIRLRKESSAGGRLKSAE